MDGNNFVGPAPGGGFDVYVGGKKVGNYADQHAAEDAYNTAKSGSAGSDPFPGYSVYNPSAEALKEQAIEFASTDAYRKAVLAGQGDQRALDAAIAAANQADKLIQTYGDQAISALSEAGKLGLGVADILSRLGGPANAFDYDRAVHGINDQGLSGSISALTGNTPQPNFQATGATSPKTLGTLAGQPDQGNTLTGSSIVNQLLGLANQAEAGYTAAGKGDGGFKIPQLNFSPGSVAPASAPASSSSTSGLYTTKNGDKTLAQMHAELQTAKYDGPWDDASVLAAYARTTGGTVTPKATVASSAAATPAATPVVASSATAVPDHVTALNTLIANKPTSAGAFVAPSLSAAPIAA